MSPDQIRDASPPDVLCWLAGVPDALLSEQVEAVRDQAARFLGSDPTTSVRLAEALARAVARSQTTVATRARAITERCRAEAAAFTGRLSTADAHYRAASEAARRDGDPGLEGQILTGWVGVLGALDRHAHSRSIAHRAQQLLSEVGDQAYLGKLFGNLGNLAYHRERYDEAHRWYARAATSFDEAGLRDRTWVGLVINEAVALTNLSRLGDARRRFMHAEETSAELGLDLLHGQALLDRAHLERLQGDYRECLTCLESAYDIFGPRDARDLVAAAARERATTYLELGMPVEANESASLAAVNFESEGMSQDAALARVQEARALIELGRSADALKVLESAEAVFATEGLAGRRAVCRLWRAEGLRREGRRADAAPVLAGAIRSLRRMKVSAPLSSALMLRARLHHEDGRHALAARSASEALSTGRRLPPSHRAELLAQGARVVRGQRPEVARRRLDRAVELLEDARPLVPGAEYRARTFARQVDVYLDLIDVLLDEGALTFDRAHALAQAARARAFRDRRSAAARSFDEASLESRARLGALVRALEEAEASGNDALRRSHHREITTLERTLHQSLRRHEAEADTADSRREGDPLDADAVAARLDRSTVIVSYLVVGTRILVLVLGRDRRVMQVLTANLTEVEAAIGRLHFQIDTLALGGSALAGGFLHRSTESALVALWRALLAPVEACLDGVSRVVIVPHRELHRVPFECLHDGAVHLDERWTIARAATADGPTGGRPRRGPVVVSGSTTGGLVAVTDEVDAVAETLSRGSREVRRLDDPSTAELLEAVRSGRIIHLAAHGVFREDNPMFSRIATSDGALFVADVWGGRVDADLVVLSACNSGRVFPGRGDDLSGVTHAFLAAGARQLVASHWRVHDEATADVMRSFHRAYAEDPRGDAAAALRRVRREVRQRWPHPFYWGGFGAYLG
jgi:CHAT domain-containing protein